MLRRRQSTRRRRLRPAPRSRRRADPAPMAPSLLPAAVDQFDAVVVGIAHEGDERAALAHAIRLALGLDALLLQLRERRAKIVDRICDVAVAGADVVRPPVVVERQLELRVFARSAEEVVRRLLLAVSDDVELAAELEAERLVEGA